MLQHIALARFKAGVGDDRIRHCFEEIGRLKELVPGLVDYSWGANHSPEGLSQGFTHAFVMTFQNVAARDAYLMDPAHEKAKQLILQIVEAAVVIDYGA
jgi:hypothetical protein